MWRHIVFFEGVVVTRKGSCGPKDTDLLSLPFVPLSHLCLTNALPPLSPPSPHSSNIVPPPVPAPRAREVQRHPFLGGRRKKYGLLMPAGRAGRVARAGQRRVRPHVLDEDRPLPGGVRDLVAVHAPGGGRGVLLVPAVAAYEDEDLNGEWKMEREEVEREGELGEPPSIRPRARHARPSPSSPHACFVPCALCPPVGTAGRWTPGRSGGGGRPGRRGRRRRGRRRSPSLFSRARASL